MNGTGNRKDKKSPLDDAQLAALTLSASIVVFFLVYWAAQIQTTYELLSAAYGW